MTQRNEHPHFTTRQHLLAAAITTCFVVEAQALPVAPTVVSGSAGFATTANTLTVTNSASAIINWQKFGIAAGETTRFIQPSASSTVLNQVVGNGSGALEMSRIYGTLSSNGRVWLVNPAGIMVGPGGMVDTAGFVASTLKVKPEDFLAGKLNFQSTPGAGDVTNQGIIRTPSGGSVYLVGPNVSNEGIITTPGGETILAAGATVELIDTGTPGVKVEITGAANNATNLGQIVATAGRIGIAGSIVRNSGTLNASSVTSEGGRVFLKASQDTYVDGSGRIVATGTKGGQVEVLGNRVAVMDDASIDVSGSNGGGTIKVGGDYQGKNPDVQNSQITYFGQNASLKSNATDNGDGGKVIVWADDTTRAYGAIEAKGGANGGDGGFVETSGHRYLDIAGARVDTRAARGKRGNWLLDPAEISIVHGSYSEGSIGGDPFAPSGGGLTEITDGDLNDFLLNSNLTIQTDGAGVGTGNITVFGATISGSYALSLLAYGDGGTTATGNIWIENSSINTNGLTIVAGWDGTGTNVAAPTIDGLAGRLEIVKSTLNSNPGALLKAAGNITIDNSSSITTSWGDVAIMAGRDIVIDGTVTSNSGDVIITAGLGYFGGDGGPSEANAYGGNITLGANSDIGAWSGYVVLQADRGTTAAGPNGIITQYGGYLWGSNGVSITAGADVKISGYVGSYGYVQIGAGLSGGRYGSYDFSPNPYGGNVDLGNLSTIQGYSGVLIRAERVTASGDNGNITQQYGGQIIAGTASCGEGCYGYGNVAIVAGGNVRIDGDVIAKGTAYDSYGHIGIAAGAQIGTFGMGSGYGYGDANSFGGNIELGGSSRLLAKGSVFLVAERGYAAGAGGNITQDSGGQIVAGYSAGSGNVKIAAGGNARLDGNVTAYSGYIAIETGTDAEFSNYYGDFSTSGYANDYGGDITLGTTSQVSSPGGYVYLNAKRGTLAAGHITQTAGTSAVYGDYGVTLHAEGSANIGGRVTTGVGDGGVYGVEIIAGHGYDNGNTLGGNIILGASSRIETSAGPVRLWANPGSNRAGDVVQYGGGVITAVGSEQGYVDIIGNNVQVDGFISVDAELEIRSGMGYTVGVGFNASGQGGNILLGTNSQLVSNAYVTLMASGGSATPGNIIQTAGGTITIPGGSSGYIDIAAAGDISLGGTVVSAGDITVRAGFDGYSFSATPRDVTINTMSGHDVYIEATGAIIDGNGRDTPNITADGIVLTSYYGGSAGVPAISLDTANAMAISATVTSSSTFGGIRIQNTGLTTFATDAPGTVSLYDYSSLGGQLSFTHVGDMGASTSINLTGGTGGVELKATGNLTENDNIFINTPAGPLVWFDAGGNLTISGSAFSLPNNPLTLSAGNTLTIASTSNVTATNTTLSSGTINIDGSVAAGGDLKAISNSTLNVTGSLSGYGIALEAPAVNIASGGSVSATVDAGVLTGTLQVDGMLSAGRDMVITSGTTTLSGGTISTATGDIEVTVDQNLKLNNGAAISAGNDILLTLKGASSTLYLNETAGLLPSTITADTFTNDGQTIYIDFLARSSGGIFIDGIETSTTTVAGGSGFFWGNHRGVATSALGLKIAYTVSSQDICQLLPEVCALPMQQQDQGNCEMNPGSCSTLLQVAGVTGTLREEETIGDGDGEFGEENKGRKRRISQCR
jgi:filamentous hemagglutinin family protein